MSDLRVLVMPHRLFKAHNGQMESVTLSDALSRHWEDEAALVTYYSPDQETIPRWTKKRLKQLRVDGGKILISCLVLDYDLHDDEGKRPWRDRDEAEAALAGIFEAAVPIPTVYYTTKHGLRLIYELEEHMAPEQSEQAYKNLLKIFDDAKIEMDHATCDWTRIFYLPFITKKGEKLWDLDYIYVEDTGIKLDGSRLLDAVVQPVQELSLDGDQPDSTSSDRLLVVKAAGRPDSMTAFMRKAKSLLGSSKDAPWLFEHQPVPFDRGDRNPGIWDLVYRVTCTLWDKVEGMTPEHVYALLRPGVGQLPMESGDTDPCSVLWEMIQRTWENKHEEKEIERVTFEEALAKIVQGFSDQCERSDTSLSLLAETIGMSDVDYVLQHLLVRTSNTGVYMMKPDGTYTAEQIPMAGMLGVIQTMGLSQVYDVFNPQTQDLRNEPEIMRRRGVAVARTQGKLGLTHPELRDIGRDTMHMLVPLHHIRTDLKPKFVPEVDQLLRLFAGKEYERLADWIGHALEITEPICALSVAGPSGAGKSFLGEILGACFAPGDKNGDEVLTTNFNLGLQENPVVHIDEGLSTANHVDELLRRYVSGGKMPLIGKGKDPIKAEVYPRVIITANDLDALRDALGRRDLGDEAHAALAVRILHLDALEAASEWLSQHNGREMTGDWVVGRSLAVRHFMWLHQERTRPSNWAGSGRFLVEGEKESEILQEFRFQTETAQVVMKALLVLLNDKKGALHIENGELWASSSAVHTYLETTPHNKLTVHAIGRVLGKIGTRKQGGPGSKTPGGRVFRLNLARLEAYAKDNNIASPTLISLLDREMLPKEGTVWPTE